MGAGRGTVPQGTEPVARHAARRHSVEHARRLWANSVSSLGPELQAMQELILTADPALDAPPRTVGRARRVADSSQVVTQPAG